MSQQHDFQQVSAESTFASKSLATFDLTNEVIHDGFRRGIANANETTRFAPPGAPNSKIYSEGVEDLGMLLNQQGWERQVVESTVLHIHPSGIMGFSVTSGIGVMSGSLDRLKTKNEKGTAISALIAANPQNPAKTSPPLPGLETTSKPNKFEYWMLLHERIGSATYLCLAKPRTHKAGKPVTDFEEFIPVEPIVSQEEIYSIPGTTETPEIEPRRKNHDQ